MPYPFASRPCFSALLLGPASRPCFSALLLMTGLVLAGLCPAQAGSWKFSCTGSFTETSSSYGNSTTPWMAPGPSTGTSYHLSGFSSPPSSGFASAAKNSTHSYDINIQAKITLTWMPAAGQTAATDPAPPSVMLIEISRARWTAQVKNNVGTITTGQGSADDGVSDAEVATTNQGVKNGAVSATANAPAGQVPPAHWTSYAVSSGVLTLDRSFQAHASVNSTGFSSNAAFNIDCSFSGYSLQIHAQPYGWYNAGHNENGVFVAGPYSDNATGTLYFTYGWNSTSGNKADLKGITIYEFLDYSGNPGTLSADKLTFNPKSSPVTSGYSVPNGKAGTPFDATSSYANDIHSPFPTVNPLQPLAPLTWTIPQTYKFDDPKLVRKG